MRVFAVLAAACLGALAPAPASAVEPEAFMIDTAADLARLCSAPETDPNRAAAIHMCHGFLVGVHHFHAAFANALGEPVYCIERAEPRPTRDEVSAALAAWIEETPGKGGMEALPAVLDWAAATFPCE
jgi:hypothetical protein